MATIVEANPHNTAVAAVVHPLIVRLTHWVNAGAMIVMLMSGWQIHNAYPTLPFSSPGMLTLGDGLARGLRWHFAAMWVLVINGAIYLAHGVISGRFRRKLLPVRPAHVIYDLSRVKGLIARADDLRQNRRGC